MSVVKISELMIFFSLFLLLIFSCKEPSIQNKSNGPEAVQFVIFSVVGGKQGDYKIVKITQDSVFVTAGKTGLNMHKSWKAQLSKQKRNSVFKHLSVQQLRFIRSTESQQMNNLADETFQVKTTKTSYVFVNAFYDEQNYKSLKNVKTELEKLIPKEYRSL